MWYLLREPFKESIFIDLISIILIFFPRHIIIKLQFSFMRYMFVFDKAIDNYVHSLKSMFYLKYNVIPKYYILLSIKCFVFVLLKKYIRIWIQVLS